MFLAILAAMLSNNIIGMLWYSPLLFMRTFLDTVRIDPSRGMTISDLIGCNILALSECFGLAYAFHLIKLSGGVMQGAKYGFLIWQFFVFPCMAVHYFFDRRPLKHLYMVAGHHLATLVVEGAIIASLQ